MKKLFEQILKESELNNEEFHKLFQDNVPNKGNADTLYGEIIRAVNRIIYRNWNDGDLFFRGYGVETAGPAAAFLMDHDDIPLEIAQHIQTMIDTNETQYEAKLEQLVKIVLDVSEETVKKLKDLPGVDLFDWSDQAKDDWTHQCPECGQDEDECECCDACGRYNDCSCYDEDEDEDYEDDDWDEDN